MISIIIVNHNYINFLEECVESVKKNKSRLVKEIIIIDDASTDGSQDMITKKYSKIPKIRIFKVKFFNLSKTLNYAINKAKGTWIFKVDADDYINSNFIKFFLKYTSKYDFIFGDLIIFDEKSKYRSKQKVKKNFLRFFKHPIGSGNLYRKKLWKVIGGYNENLYYKDDVYFWSKISQIKNLKIKNINKPCYHYRKHNKSMSTNFIKKYLTLLRIIIF